MTFISETAIINKVISATGIIKKTIPAIASFDLEGLYLNFKSTFFDGIDDRIEVDALQVALVGTLQGAISFRMKIPISDTKNHFPIVIGDTDGASFLGFIASNGGNLARVVLQISGVTQWLIQFDTPPIGTDWFHWAITHDSVAPILYFDGIAPPQGFLVSTDKTAWIGAGDGFFDNMRIGCANFNNNGNINFVGGNLDEIRVWNVNKSAADILADHNSGVSKTPDPIGLVSTFRMGEGDTFPTVIDSESGKNGTMVNMSAGSFVSDVSP